MSSALRVILGVSFLGGLACVACDDGTDGGDGNTGGTLVAAGTSSTSAGTSTTAGTTSTTGGSSATGGTGPVAAGVPLTPTDGWVDQASNTLGIQGAMFAYADDTSKMGMTENFMGASACIKGTAAEVVMGCTIVPPATDCYGTFWGAAIGLNLNQPIDMTTMMGADPMPFDAGAKGITGFAFEITGEGVPTSLRFKVEDASGEYCNTKEKPVLKGANSFTFADLHSECWEMTATMNPNAEAAKSGLLKIAWQVVTKTGATVPFDYCVTNVRALTQ
jgi:hypothetical protein